MILDPFSRANKGSIVSEKMQIRSKTKACMVAIILLSSFLLGVPLSASATQIKDFINKQNCDQIILKKNRSKTKLYYQICYNYKAKGPKYVGYVLNGRQVKKGHIKNRPNFYPEPLVPVEYRATKNDYKKRHYSSRKFPSDKGHLAPHASFNYSQEALESVYSMANIIPQCHKINQHAWVKAENYEREMAKKYRSLTVINGVEYGKNPRKFKKSGIAYPAAFWKILFNDKKGFEECYSYNNDCRLSLKSDALKAHIARQLRCPVSDN